MQGMYRDMTHNIIGLNFISQYNTNFHCSVTHWNKFVIDKQQFSLFSSRVTYGILLKSTK